MRPSTLTKQLAKWRETTRPTIAVWGPPGAGKSEIIAACANEGKEQFLDFRALLHDPSDLKFPIVQKDTVRWVQSIFPTDKDWRGIILMDELPNAPPLMQSALLQLTLDRKLGDYMLPRNAWLIAAGNRIEDRAGAGRIIQSLSTRFACQITLEVHHEDWQAWASAHGISTEVRSYLAFRPSNLHNFEAARSGAQPTPRTWKFLSDLIPTVDASTEQEVFAGCVSEGPAMEFCEHRKIHAGLPDVAKLLAEPGKARVPREPEILYAISYAIGDHCRKAPVDTIRAGMEFCLRLPKEFQVVLVRQLACKSNQDHYGISFFDKTSKDSPPEWCDLMASVGQFWYAGANK